MMYQLRKAPQELGTLAGPNPQTPNQITISLRDCDLAASGIEDKSRVKFAITSDCEVVP